MDKININLQLTAEMIDQLASRRAPATTFTVADTPEVAFLGILGRYVEETQSRGVIYHDATETRSNAAKTAEMLTAADSRRFGIWIAGGVGSGKTTFMTALMRYLSDADQRGALHSPSEYFRWSPMMIDAMEIARCWKNDEARKSIIGRPQLFIDDAGSEPAEVMDFGNAMSPITELVCARYARRLFTVVTSNLKADEVRTRYGARMADRLNEMCMKLAFSAKSYRNQIKD